MRDRTSRTLRGIALCACAAAAAAAAATAAPSTKEETVFCVLSPTGEVRNVIVSDWLHGSTPGAAIADRSTLTGIKNVQGPEAPVIGRDGSLTWKPAGADVYYQGVTTRKPPLAVSVSYTLDGKAMAPADMAGKSGLVRITVRVRNTDAHAVDRAGRQATLYTPMMAAIVMNLPLAAFSDVALSRNGAMVSDGQNSLAVGVMLPGVADSIPLDARSREVLDRLGLPSPLLPDELTVTARTTGFRLGPIIITATPKLPDLGLAGTAAGNGPGLQETLPRLRAGAQDLMEGARRIAATAQEARGSVDSLDVEGLLAESGAFIMDDANIAAARALMADADRIKGFDLSLLDLVPRVLSPDTRALLTKTLADAKKVDLKSITNAPFAGLLITDETLKNISQAMSESDAFYRALDARGLESARAFIDSSARTLTLAAEAADADRSAAAAFDAATAVVADDAARDGLLQRLRASKDLSDADKAALAAVVGASAARRAADADQAPRREAARTALAASRAALTPGAVAAVDSLVPRVQQLKAVHDRNRVAYRMADFILKIVSCDRRLKGTIADIDALQRDVAALQPVIQAVKDKVGPDAMERLGDGTELVAGVRSMAADLDRAAPLMKLGSRLLEERTVRAARALVEAEPGLRAGIEQAGAGSRAIAETLGCALPGSRPSPDDLAALFDGLRGSADTVDAALATVTRLLELSRGYRSFSGIDPAAQGSVKFVMRTEEIPN
jgi:hypothetical protein